MRRAVAITTALETGCNHPAFPVCYHQHPLCTQFHSSADQRISVKQALLFFSPPPSPRAFCFSVLFWVRVLSRMLELPSYPTFTPLSCLSYLADADFHNLCEINKYTSSPSTVLHVHRFSCSPSIFEFLLIFDKRNLKGGSGGGSRWRVLDKSWSLAWSSCVFWERLSRVSCKEDVAEKQCFLPDKSKASLRQDVWAPAGPALKEPVAREREPAVRFSREETWLSLINISHRGFF